jgi:hypothetical protein
MAKLCIFLAFGLLATAAAVPAPFGWESRFATLETDVVSLKAEAAELRETVSRQAATIEALAAACKRGEDDALFHTRTSRDDLSGGAHLRGEVARGGSEDGGPAFVCPCDTFNATTVTIGDGSGVAQLIVGSPATGLVNGVNVVALANSAVRNFGDQTIAGTLSVQALQIGEWSLSQDGSGNLVADSPSGSRVSITVEGGVSMPGELVSTAGVSTSGALSVSGAAIISGATSVQGHNLLDPATYGTGWCDCYVEREGIMCNPVTYHAADSECTGGVPVPQFGDCGVNVSAGCQRSGYFVVGPVSNQFVCVGDLDVGGQCGLSYGGAFYSDPLDGYEVVEPLNDCIGLTCCRPCVQFSSPTASATPTASASDC